MKKLLVSISFLFVFLGMFGCATTGLVVDSKYEFDDFTQVDRISNYNLDNWQVVDDQSLIIQTAPSTYYLVVLKRSLVDLRFAQTIGFTSTVDRVYANLDRLKVFQRHSSMSPEEAAIHSIYKLNGKEDIARAKAQIESESKAEGEPEKAGSKGDSERVNKREVLLTT